MSRDGLRIRAAVAADVAALRELIARSARELSVADYTPAQVEGALRGAFGVDSQLIRDGTYFVVECAGELVGCGGWSRRRTLFGGDAFTQRDAAELDPIRDAAKIRAFFVHPDHARRGIGSALLAHCETAAQAHGFTRCELMSTLPGLKLYRRHGYQPGERVFHDVGGGETVEFVPMHKSLR